MDTLREHYKNTISYFNFVVDTYNDYKRNNVLFIPNDPDLKDILSSQGYNVLENGEAQLYQSLWLGDILHNSSKNKVEGILNSFHDILPVNGVIYLSLPSRSSKLPNDNRQLKYSLEEMKKIFLDSNYRVFDHYLSDKDTIRHFILLKP